MPNVDSRVAAIYRHDRPIIPQGDTVIEPKDEVFFIAAPEHIADMMTELRTVDASYGKRDDAGRCRKYRRAAGARDERDEIWAVSG